MWISWGNPWSRNLGPYCVPTISRHDIDRHAFLLVWNLALMHHSEENSWNLQARSCGEISNSSSLIGPDFYRPGQIFLRNCWWWELFCLFHWKLKPFQIKNKWGIGYREFLAGLCFRMFAAFRLWEHNSLQTTSHTVGNEVIWLGSAPGRWDSSELWTAIIVISGGAIICAWLKSSIARWEPGETLYCDICCCSCWCDPLLNRLDMNKISIF